MSDSNNKLTYAQVAANPPSTNEDENATKSTGDTDEQLTEKNYTSTGRTHLSKTADKIKNSIPSLPSTWSSEPEIIDVEPPIPPPVDKMKKPPQPTPEPVKQSKPAADDEPKKKKEEPQIMDNVADDFAPLKHTTMLTKKNGKGAAADSANGTLGENDESNKAKTEKTLHSAESLAAQIRYKKDPKQRSDDIPCLMSDDLFDNKDCIKGIDSSNATFNTYERNYTENDEFEVISNETEKHRRYNRALIAGSGILLIGIVAFGIWKWTHRRGGGRAK